MGCKALGELINITKADLNNKIGNTHSIVETHKKISSILKTYKAISKTGEQEHPIVTHESIDKEGHADRHYGRNTRKHIHNCSSMGNVKTPDICQVWRHHKQGIIC